MAERIHYRARNTRGCWSRAVSQIVYKRTCVEAGELEDRYEPVRRQDPGQQKSAGTLSSVKGMRRMLKGECRDQES